MDIYGTTAQGAGFGYELTHGGGSVDTLGHRYGDALSRGDGFGSSDCGDAGDGTSDPKNDIDPFMQDGELLR